MEDLIEALKDMLRHDPESGCCNREPCDNMLAAAKALVSHGVSLAPGCVHWPIALSPCPNCGV